jgi:hypothetical protein
VGALLLATSLAGAVVDAAAAGGLPRDLPPGSPAPGSRELQALVDFQRDPVANGPALLALAAGPIEELPMVIVLAAADASLRAGHFRGAGRFFAETLRRRPGQPWATFAELGLGWTLLMTGNSTAAERHYANVAVDGPLGPIAQVMLGWLTAVRGQYAEAIATLDRWSEAAGVTGPVQRVALLGAGYARYWAGDYKAAAEKFDLLQPGGSFSVLADDARYGAAWSRVRAGDTSRALADLVALAESGIVDPHEHVSRARLRLTPRAVLRAGRGNAARISGLATPETRMTAFFDGNGHALARAALAELVGSGVVAPASVPERLLIAPAARVPVARAQAVDMTAGRVPSSARSAAPPASRGATWRRIVWLAIVLAVVAGLVLWRRQPVAGRR